MTTSTLKKEQLFSTNGFPSNKIGMNPTAGSEQLEQGKGDCEEQTTDRNQNHELHLLKVHSTLIGSKNL